MTDKVVGSTMMGWDCGSPPNRHLCLCLCLGHGVCLCLDGAGPPHQLARLPLPLPELSLLSLSRRGCAAASARLPLVLPLPVLSRLSVAVAGASPASSSRCLLSAAAIPSPAASWLAAESSPRELVAAGMRPVAAAVMLIMCVSALITCVQQ